MTQEMTKREKVVEFYEGFKQGEFVASLDEPASLDESKITAARKILKLDLIAEEFKELVDAVLGKKAGQVIEEAWTEAKKLDEGVNDIVEAADATADLKYVILGFEIETGIDGDKIFSEVHRSNMSKLGRDGNPVISDGSTGKPVGKVLKGEDWFEPDLKAILEGREPDRTPFILKEQETPKTEA